jgi:uncharacterized membrane protein YoaK (UPF0700 family)
MQEASTHTVGSLGALTFVTGLIDAVSLLGLGHVFVANMTGNVVFLGFSLVGQGATSLAACALALAGFLGGAVIGGRSMKLGGANGLRGALALDVALLSAAGCLATFWTGVAVQWLVLLLAGAMGIRTAVVRALAIPDMNTTVLTLTLAGIAADSSLAGGENPRLGRRLTSVASVLAGASIGALLFSRATAYVVVLAATVEACAALSLVRSLAKPPPVSDALGAR